MPQSEAKEQSVRAIGELVSLVVKRGALTPAEIELLDCLKRRFPKGFDESELARELHRDPNWDKRHTDIRTSVARLRGKLDHFYRYVPGGKEARVRLSLPRGTPYRILSIDNHQTLDPVERFWDTHFNNGAENLIIYTEPLFFWDKEHRCYIRYLDINADSPSVDAKQIRAAIPARHPARQLVPCFHYQSAGETQAQRILRKWFEQQGKVRVEVSRECVEGWVWDYNLIVLGNSRTNRFLNQLQEGLSIILEDDKIIVQQESGRGVTVYQDSVFSTIEPKETFIYAAVTRMPSRAPNRCVTLIAANHGRAIEKVADFLTTPINLVKLFSDLHLESEAPLPSTFQLLFRLKLLDHELVAGKPELVHAFVKPLDLTP